jgi:solute carrier family 25 phosphate transporter 23/24/25/41
MNAPSNNVVCPFFQEIMNRADQDASSGLDFQEFMTYMQSHEQKLRLAFSDLDRNKDGMIHALRLRQLR